MKAKPKVGDLVRWLHDNPDWVTLGTVVEVDTSQFESWKFRVIWHEDYEDIEDYKGVWYNPEDWVEQVGKV